MKQKPAFKFLQIWNMCFGFLGIQIGFSLQNANVSRIFQTLGAETENLAVYWVAAPLTGLIVQPIIGYMSDRTWNRFGRRRPYFTVGAVLASLALIVMPNSSSVVVRRRHALDTRCEHQYHDGAVSRLRRRHAARAATHGRVLDADLLHRYRRSPRVGAAVDHDEPVRGREHGGRGGDPAFAAVRVLCRRDNLPGIRNVDRVHDARVFT